MAIVNMTIGLITPPSGMLPYVPNALPGVPINAMLREGWLFLLILLALLLAMTAVAADRAVADADDGSSREVSSGMHVGGARRATMVVCHAFPEDHHADPA